MCEIEISIHEKFKKVIEKNIGLEIIIKINDIFIVQGKLFHGVSENLKISDLACFKYVSLPLTNIKRSF